MLYRHWAKVTRTNAGGGGVQDDDGGYTPAAPGSTTLYDGAADVQDGQVSVPRTSAGDPVVTADAVVFLKNASAAENCSVGDAVVLTYPPSRSNPTGRTKDAEVVRVTEDDGSLLVAINKRTA